MRETPSPATAVPIRVVEPPRDPSPVEPTAEQMAYYEHVIRVDNLTDAQVGAVGEKATARFLAQRAQMRTLDLATRPENHKVTARGIDHILVTQHDTLVIAESKATRGTGVVTQRAYAKGKSEGIAGLLKGDQATPAWINRDPTFTKSGLDASMVESCLASRIDLTAQTIEVYELTPEGNWDKVYDDHVDVSDLVADCFRNA